MVINMLRLLFLIGYESIKMIPLEKARTSEICFADNNRDLQYYLFIFCEDGLRFVNKYTA